MSILVERSESITTVTLNRPERLNAITWPMLEAMLDAIAACGSDPSVRLLVFRGAGRAFSSGDDIGEGMGVRSSGGEPEAINAERGLHYLLVRQLLELPKPVVAAIHGRC